MTAPRDPVSPLRHPRRAQDRFPVRIRSPRPSRRSLYPSRSPVARRAAPTAQARAVARAVARAGHGSFLLIRSEELLRA